MFSSVHGSKFFKDGKKQKVLFFEQCCKVYKMHSCIWSHLILMTAPWAVQDSSHSPHCIDALAKKLRVSENCQRPHSQSGVESWSELRFPPPCLIIVLTWLLGPGLSFHMQTILQSLQICLSKNQLEAKYIELKQPRSVCQEQSGM